MAKIIRRTWTSQGPTGKRVKHVAYGYTLMVNGERQRKVSSGWLTESDAVEALAARQKELAAGIPSRPADRTLAELGKEYLRYKGDHGKRSLDDDRRIIEKRLLPALGASLPVRKLTAAAIAQYERQRLGATVEGRDRKVSTYTVSNELSVLRHMLRLAKRWGCLEAAPEIEMPKKPAGRLRYLETDEIRRLLDACRRSLNPDLFLAVVLALGTGMRKGEVLSLEWERVDLSSARITLYTTKSAKPRGVPINGDVYDALVAFAPDADRRQGRLFSRDYGRRASQIRKASAGVSPGRHRRLSVPRPPAHRGEPHGHARGNASGGEGDPRAQRPRDDPPLCPPEPGPPPLGRRPLGRAGPPDRGADGT